MRIAVCIYGRFNNRHSSISGAEGFLEIKRMVDSYPEHTFEFWIYSTDTAEESNIRHLFGTLGAVIKIEPQQDFSKLIQSQGLEISKFKVPSGFRSFENLLSFLYSRGSSIRMMLGDLSDEVVDWVIVSRFDSGQLDRHNGRQRARVAPLGFNNFLEAGFIYSAAWDQHNIGYADQWFICSKSQAEQLACMYESVQGYLKAGSPYLQTLTHGIPDSNVHDPFSNERFLPTDLKSKAPLRLSIGNGLNAHLMHKYFFIESGLYSESRFSLNIGDVAMVVYSHSDYFDALQVFHDSTNLKFNAFRKRHLICDEGGTWGSKGYNVVRYDEGASYVDRLIQGLAQIDDELIFFNHEDFPLFAMPDQRHFLDGLELVASRELDYFTFARGGHQVGLPVFSRKSISKFLNYLSPWIFSIQPSIWRREKLLALLEKHRGQGIWEFEAKAQKTFRKIGLKGGFTRAKGRKRGSLHWDNPLYPYVATAVVKGKWNTAEYPAELSELLANSGLETSQRTGNADSV